MEANADSIALDVTRMMGKPLGAGEGRGEGHGAARAPHDANRRGVARRRRDPRRRTGFERRIAKEPLGVVFDLPAWNYPLLTAVNAVDAGGARGQRRRREALAAHVRSAASTSRARSTRPARPRDLVQALHCDHPTSERIVGDARVDHVLFTGSVFGGHRIQQAAASTFIARRPRARRERPGLRRARRDLEKTVENIVDGACLQRRPELLRGRARLRAPSLYDELPRASPSR